MLGFKRVFRGRELKERVQKKDREIKRGLERENSQREKGEFTECKRELKKEAVDTHTMTSGTFGCSDRRVLSIAQLSCITVPPGTHFAFRSECHTM
jgi:hypothetical protein